MTDVYQQKLADRGAYAKFLISPCWRGDVFYAKGEQLLEQLYLMAREDIQVRRSLEYVSPVYREACFEAVEVPVPQVDAGDLYEHLFKHYFHGADPDYAFSPQAHEAVAALNAQLLAEVPRQFVPGEPVPGAVLEEMLRTYIDTVHPVREFTRPLWNRIASGDGRSRSLNPLLSRQGVGRDRCVGYPWMITLDLDKARQKQGFRWEDMKTFQLCLREQETGRLITCLPSIPCDFADVCGETLDHAVSLCRNSGPNGSVWDRIFLWAEDVQQIVRLMDVTLDGENRAYLDSDMLLRRVTEKHFGRKAEKRTA